MQEEKGRNPVSFCPSATSRVPCIRPVRRSPLGWRVTPPGLPPPPAPVARRRHSAPCGRGGCWEGWPLAGQLPHGTSSTLGGGTGVWSGLPISGPDAATDTRHTGLPPPGRIRPRKWTGWIKACAFHLGGRFLAAVLPRPVGSPADPWRVLISSGHRSQQ